MRASREVAQKNGARAPQCRRMHFHEAMPKKIVCQQLYSEDFFKMLLKPLPNAYASMN